MRAGRDDSAGHAAGAGSGPDGAGPVQQAYTVWLDCCTDAGWRPARAPAQRLPVAAAVGRTTAAPVHALWSSPAEPRAAMDGIAVRAADTEGATPDRPLRLAEDRYDVVDTGDPLPDGRDAVIMREHLRRGGTGGPRTSGVGTGGIGTGGVEISEAVPAGRHVRPAGEDVVAGELLLPAGHRIRPVDAAVAAGAGHVELLARPRPVCAILPTGDELRPIGATPGRGEVLDTNSLLLAETVRELGGRPLTAPIVPDDPAALAAAITSAAARADLVLVIAGSSAGRDDHTAAAVATVGKVAVHGVAIRPGHPVLLGVVDGDPAVPIVGVPGYPVSALTVAELFVAPMLAALTGADGAAERAAPPVTAVLTDDVRSSAHHEHHVPVLLDTAGDQVLATPCGRGAAALSAVMRADGTVLVPAGVDRLPAGSRVTVTPRPGASRSRR